jgi:hypothetical protein
LVVLNDFFTKIVFLFNQTMIETNIHEID